MLIKSLSFIEKYEKLFAFIFTRSIGNGNGKEQS